MMRAAATGNRSPGPGRGKLLVAVLDNPSQLSQYQPAWTDLAQNALEPNVCYEPWMLLPAQRTLAENQPLRFVLAFAADRGPDSSAPLLHGFFPLVQRRGYRGLPIRLLSLWQHSYSFLTVPLLRAGHARETLAAFLEWARTSSAGAALIEFPQAPAQGPFQELLVEHCRDQARLTFLDEIWSRALFRPRASADSYLAEALSGKHRHELRRLERRLGELGRLDQRTLEKGEDLPGWIDAFLSLEASGWKGRTGTALASTAASRSFFRELAGSAFAAGRLQMLGLFLNDRPIAMKCNLLSGSASFGFKIAFDETLARYSPGTQLEMFSIRFLHEQTPRLDFLDSCAVTDQEMLNRLWLDRRLIQSVLLSTGRFPGDLVVSLLPLLRWVKRCLRPPRRAR